MKASLTVRTASAFLWTLSGLVPAAYAQVGPDLVTGHLNELKQLARQGPIGSGTVGLGLSTTGCNKGNTKISTNGLPFSTTVTFANLYRIQTVDGSIRLEQIGQSWVKHAGPSLNADDCGFGCESVVPFTVIPPGCSLTYSATEFDACGAGLPDAMLGARSNIHPYRGGLLRFSWNLGPGGGCSYNYSPANHIGHDHSINELGLQDNTDISHRLQVPDSDLMPTQNVGARYFAEGGWITTSELPAEGGNPNNNYAYREVTVLPPDTDGVFVFNNVSSTFSESPAVDAWISASQSVIEPAPLADGLGILAYEATDLGGGTWHYEYALFNMNNDASFGSFGIPLPSGVNVSNIGFHAPLNHAPVLFADNYGNEPWSVTVVPGDSITWTTDDFDVDPMANAVRWGTMYNFRFDADAAPRSVFATVEQFKLTGTLNVAAVGPQASGVTDCNGNGIDDTCELDCKAVGCSGISGCGSGTDCDGTGVLDACEIDCNGNGVDDRCDIAGGSSADCTGNGVPDECEPDCDGDGTPDSCEMLAGVAEDCNADGVLDNCTVPGGPLDQDANGIPDACECWPFGSNPSPPAGTALGNRYLQISGPPHRMTKVQVTLLNGPAAVADLIGQSWWVIDLREVNENSGTVVPSPGEPTLMVATLGCETEAIGWTGFDLLAVYHPAIVPNALYEVVESCVDPASPPWSVVLSTSIFGDIRGTCTTFGCAPPDGSVDVTSDVVGVLDKFRNFESSPSKALADLEPETVDQIINISDAAFCLDAFRGLEYPFTPTTLPCAP